MSESSLSAVVLVSVSVILFVLDPVTWPLTMRSTFQTVLTTPKGAFS